MTPPQTGAAPAALYRRYRPETFADVIGQEHVTGPLMQALRTGRVGHAYLFSGPRGCGKTTSARILARCLNCAEGPTPEPCGECESCVALARGGSGSVDVIEIDAASHGGVDDARDLRERASFGPAQSRFKIYIIDEAHMVTPQGFNALLKIVEEPPEHVKFVFATTEPEKVIGTIRSRTHHYPFRLVPPQRMNDYMAQLCEAEGVAVEPGVLSFVTRAGGGSVRDSLSVLDQLIAGSGDEGLTYAGAAALLGFTDAELLDATIDALAAGDGAATFRQVDKVIESGLDPRRFVEDLLERLRDLIIVQAVPDGAAQVLRGVPEDQLERMRQQAASFGQGTLSRAADIVNTGLTEMTGATSPRLQLELICARVLLPAASGEQGYAARLDRLERRLDIGGATPPPRAEASPGTREASPGTRETSPSTRETSPSTRETSPSTRETSPSTRETSPGTRETSPGTRETSPEDRGIPEPPPQAAPQSAPSSPAPAGGGLDTDAIRRAWPDVLDRIFHAKRVTWALLSQHAHVLDFDGERLLLGTTSSGLAQTFARGQHPDIVRRALHEALGVDVRVEAQPDEGGHGGGSVAPPSGSSQPPGARMPPEGFGGGPAGPDRPRAGDVPPPRPDQDGAPPPADRPGGAPVPEWPEDREPVPVQPSEPQTDDRPGGAPAPQHTSGSPGHRAREAARRATGRARQPEAADGWGAVSAPPPQWATAAPADRPDAPPNPSSSHPESAPAEPAGDVRGSVDPDVRGGVDSMDDENVDDLGEVGIPVIASVLGGTVIDDQVEQ